MFRSFFNLSLRFYAFILSISRPSHHNGELESHTRREEFPKTFALHGLSSLSWDKADYIHEIVFAVRQQNIAKLTQILHDKSSPSSENFGIHLTREEIAEISFDKLSHDTLVAHLSNIGASMVSETSSGDFITASAPVLVWEKMFNTEFNLLCLPRNERYDFIVARADRYWIPKELDEHIENVFNVIDMPDARQIHGAACRLSEKNRRISRRTLLGEGLNSTRITHRGIFINSGDGSKSAEAKCGSHRRKLKLTSHTDLTDVKNVEESRILVASVGSCATCGKYPVCEGDRHNTVRTARSLKANKSPTSFWHNESIVGWLALLANSNSPPLVVTISHHEEERSQTIRGQETLNTLLIKLGAMGVTVVASASSGRLSSPLMRGYHAHYLASSPYITSVGFSMVSVIVSLHKYNYISLTSIH